MNTKMNKKQNKKQIKNINQKVLKLMQLMVEHNYITMTEILMLYPEPSAFRYLDLLERKGLLKRADLMQGLSTRKLYYLSGEGYNYLNDEGLLRVRRRFTRSDFSHALFAHNLVLVQVRIILEKHPAVVDFSPEQVLRAERGRNPERECDAEVVVQPLYGSRETYGIEVQFSKRSEKRWREDFIYPLERRDDLKKILWVCPEHLYRHARASISKFLQQDKHHFVRIENLRKYGLEAEWQKEYPYVGLEPDLKKENTNYIGGFPWIKKES